MSSFRRQNRNSALPFGQTAPVGKSCNEQDVVGYVPQMMIDCGFNHDQCQNDQQRNVFCRKPADDEKCRQHDHQNREDDAEHGSHAND